MIYMTKYFCISLLFLSSCSLVEFKDVPAVARSLIYGPPEIDVTMSSYEKVPYSFAKINIGRSGSGLMILLSINDDVYEWVGSNGEVIFTKNGKIIRTIGLEYDVNILNPKINFLNCGECYSQYFIELSNPKALINQNSFFKNSHKEKLELIKKIDATVMIENFSTSKFKWTGENIYWFDDSGQVIKSNQQIHPSLGEIEITFYYK